MTAWRQTLAVARWDLQRFFKWRDVVLSVVITAVIAGVSYAASAWQRSSRDVVRLAAISDLALTGGDRLEVELRPASDEEALRAEVARGDRDGLLLASAERVRVIARKEPVWLGDVGALVTAAAQARRLAALGVSAAQVSAALAPVPLAVELTSGSHRGSARTAALILVGVMLFTLFIGTSYLFMAITGEKQQRATEQLFTMTTPQVLIDGKLLGVSALGAIAVVQMGGVGLVMWHAFSSGSLASVASALAGISAGHAVVLAAFAVAGTAFWLATTATLFATIDDPNSSARNSAMMLPLLPLSVAFIGFGSPDSGMMQALSYVPLTSMTVVPARMVLGEISPLTIAVSLALLVGATWWMRRAAARIYEAAMLMYGKEPSFGEMLRWIRRGRR